MEDRKEISGDFVLCVSESVGGMNERGIYIDMLRLLEESWVEVGCEKGDLGWIEECFEDDFNDRDCGWLYWEVKEIREWIKNKKGA